MTPRDDDAHAALGVLLTALDAAGYDFTTITPESHAHVVARTDKMVAHSLRDIFGWSRPFPGGLLPAELLDALDRAGRLTRRADLFESRVRVTRVAGSLFLHSAYPTDDSDSVFLGPDTYRFVRFIAAELERHPGARRIVDIGAGAGVGGIVTAKWTGAPVTLADVNTDALWLAGINADHAGIAAHTIEANGLPDDDGDPFDLVIANPPFIMDSKGRDYRDGGDLHGAGLSRDWALSAADRLPRGGRLLLYTGSAIVDGRDGLRDILDRELPARGCTLRYEEIDPDIFGEELANPAYRDVDRIAAVGIVVTRAG